MPLLVGRGLSIGASGSVPWSGSSGGLRQRVFRDGRFWDDILMGITREEFLGLPEPATQPGAPTTRPTSPDW